MMSARKRILLATTNPGKIAELGSMLGALPVEVVGLDAFGDLREVAETGATFEENARLKAAGYALQVGLPAIADDSGLEVAALDGRPGVLSARYGGEDTTFAEKIRLLLAEVDAAAAPDRRARFVCSIAVAGADGSIRYTAEGECRGVLAQAPRGEGGFGYDPVFVPDGYDETFGELPDAIKAKISHRARAFSHIVPFLRVFGAI